MPKFEVAWNDESRDPLTIDADYMKSDDKQVQLMKRGGDSRLPGPAKAMGIGDTAVFVAPMTAIRYARELSE